MQMRKSLLDAEILKPQRDTPRMCCPAFHRLNEKQENKGSCGQNLSSLDLTVVETNQARQLMH